MQFCLSSNGYWVTTLTLLERAYWQNKIAQLTGNTLGVRMGEAGSRAHMARIMQFSAKKKLIAKER